MKHADSSSVTGTAAPVSGFGSSSSPTFAPSPSPSPAPHQTLARAAWCALWLALAALLWWQLYPRQLERGCWMGEWPFEAESCNPATRAMATDFVPVEPLNAHLQRNVGDSHAYLWLAQYLWKQDRPQALALLPTLQVLAPHDNRTLIMQADSSLQAGDWQRAAAALVQLVERGQTQARQPLAQLMADPRAQGAVLAQVQPGTRWLDGTLAAAGATLPADVLLPFIGQGLPLGLVSMNTLLGVVDRLKAANQWLDAYGLWVAGMGQVNEGLFNPGFDQRVSHRGFDWHWPRQTGGKQGQRISQVSAAPQPGHLLQIELTGRAAVVQPLVHQDLVLLGTHYRLSGRYMADRFRTREGVVWTVRCAQGGLPLGQTAALKDTQRQWTFFAMELEVPPACAGAVRLQLQTAQAWEARAGLSGVLYFDGLELVALPGATASGKAANAAVSATSAATRPTD